MARKVIFIFLGILIYQTFSFSADLEKEESEFPQDYFIPPLKIPLVLSGTFGELRSNHFHAGIDIKTNNEEGYRIYAVADGYVSRVKVSPYGYGNAIYITHPNGYISVYGHLSRFKEPIASFVRDQQYSKESFAVDLYLKKNQITVSQGDIVALSGNSGGSMGPHLHFEIRNMQQRPINPLLFGFDIKDTIPPLFQAVSLINIDRPNQVKNFNVRKRNGSYKVYKDTLTVPFKNVGVGAKVFDKLNAANNQNGTYQIDMELDGQKVYGFEVKEIGFDEKRYINCHIDYRQKLNNKGYYQRCYLLPGNRLKSYKDVKTPSIIKNLDQGKAREVRLLSRDVPGNESEVSFYVKYEEDPEFRDSIPEYDKKFPYHLKNTFLDDEIYLDFPINAFYDTVYFNYNKQENTDSTIFSSIHHVHEPYEPVHKSYGLFIKPKNLPESLKHKALIVHQRKNGRISAEGGYWKDNYITTKTRQLGTFFVKVDTVAPKIKPINLGEQINAAGRESIKFIISDDLSGIEEYRGTIDGKWILMEYDAKNNLLKYLLDGELEQGIHELKLVVKDQKMNESTFTAILKK